MASELPAERFEYQLDLPDTETGPAELYDGGDESVDGAAFSHVYRHLGTATIQTAVIWRGAYVVTNNIRGGGSSAPVPYDPVAVSGTHTMPIVSIRSELRNGPP